MDIVFVSEVKGYPDYLVYSCGLVWSKITNKFLKWILNDSNNGRVCLCLRRDKFYLSRLMAECFLDFKRDDKREIDHIDRNPFNNDISNLRIATRTQNMANRAKRTDKETSSKYKGVSWNNKSQNYSATISIKDKSFRIGSFDTEEEACIAYNNKAIQVHGDFAFINTL